MMEYNVYVISASRWDKLPFTDAQKKKYFFLVKGGQKEKYEEYGCSNVIETGSLMDSRNYALEHSFKENKICVQLSDDLKKVSVNKNFGEPVDVDLDVALDEMVGIFNKTNSILMGIPPTPNDFYAKTIISRNTFCIGDCFFVKPTHIRFDKNLTLKEDYDFTLQVLWETGECFRIQKYLFTFQHYTNSGGAVDIRNTEEEQKNIKYLQQKWGKDIVRLNPKRDNEILIKWKEK